MTPWDELDRALEALEEAERHGDLAELMEARGDVKHAHDRLALFSTSLFIAAAEGLYVPDSTWKVMAERLGVMAALQEARQCRRIARAVLSRCEDMRAELAELRRMVDNLTPGVGEPKR